MLKAVFVDWFGTLSDARFFEHWSEPGHPRREAFDRLQEWWFDGASQAFLDGWLTGTLRAEDFVERMHELLGLPRKELWTELLRSLGHWTLLEPETSALLAALRGRGLLVVLATENVDACVLWALPSMGLGSSFDAVLSSHELGARKHEMDEAGRSRFFGAYLEAHGIGPGESVIVDDSVHLREPLRAFGIELLHAPRGAGPGDHLRRILHDLG